MADEKVVADGHGFEGNDSMADNFYDFDSGENDGKLKLKFESLEHDNATLVKEKRDMKIETQKLINEIESLKSSEYDLKMRLRATEQELEQAREKHRAQDLVSPGRVELEKEVLMLKQALASAVYKEEESTGESSELRRVLKEKELKLEEVQKEKAEEENKVSDLQRQMIEKIGQKDREISELKKKTQELETELLGKVELQKKLMEFEAKAKEMKKSLLELEKEDQADRKHCQLKEKSMNSLGGIEVELDEKPRAGLKSKWPVLAVGSTSLIVASAAVIYLCHAKRR